MGKWDHRPSRRFYRQRRSSTYPTKFYDLHAPLPDFSEDGIPLWEKKYCTLIGLVPWQKIVDSKMLMSCHSNILNWNDSAAEEAFHTAKKQYWAKVNSLPSDISPPNPDIYIEKIDWNPNIDPELVKDLDRAYFAPTDEVELNATSNKRTKSSPEVDNGNSDIGENPCECNNNTNVNGAVEIKVRGWNQWDNHADDSGNVDNAHNPWESSISSENKGLTDNAWKGDGVKSWGWNRASDCNNYPKDWDCGYNPWENSSVNDKGWGEVRGNSWNQQLSQFSNNNGNHWECKGSRHNGVPLGRGWKNDGANAWGWKQNKNGNVSSDLEFRRNCGGWSSRNQSYQSREGSHQHSFGCSSSRFQRDDHQTRHYWRRGNTKKRVCFPPE
ncbi:hypothetical protein L6164_017890 [Bauhinia variegata]|uniref:Uncharacterized protein n=1 Tax=Bauhinia variegata TaxID=167791 RepID=A0ACB9NAJ5_BAUVA|nr:hypothetical protein L6164_017890 [Bauhinia variegata]